MSTIYKYVLASGVTHVNTYDGARFVHAAEQHGRMHVYIRGAR